MKPDSPLAAPWKATHGVVWEAGRAVTQLTLNAVSSMTKEVCLV